MKRLVLFICTILCANVLSAQIRFTLNDLTYEVINMNPLEVEVYQANNYISGDLVIPATVNYEGLNYNVVRIKGGVFANKGIYSVTIPESIDSIGSSAFSGCSSLSTLNFNAVNCKDLEYKQTASAAGWYIHVFKDCPISKINIGNNVQRIPKYFIYNNNTLTSITIPENVKYIERDAFYDCSRLDTVNFNATYCNSNHYSFNEQSVINIGNNVELIPDNFIKNNDVITNINIPNGVIHIGNSSFSDCDNLISINIPNSVISIGSHAFYGCDNLITINIPDNVISIGSYAFYGCSNLSSITISNNVSMIENSVFEGCNNLSQITLGESISIIGDRAFFNCGSLQDIISLPTNPPLCLGTSVFPYSNTSTLTVPCGSLEAYSASNSLWNMFFNGRIEEDCSGLEDAEFADLSVYPNPTRGKVSFSQAIEKVEVIDLSGKTLQTYENANEINIEALSAGVYHLRMTIGDKTTTRKIIKE